MRRSQSFQNKLVLLFLFSIILPISILSSCLAYYLQKRILKDSAHWNAQTARENGRNL